MSYLLGPMWESIQTRLFPVLEEYTEVLSDREKRFVRICELLSLEKSVIYGTAITGRPPAERIPIARAFVCKSLYNFGTTKILREHLLRDATLRCLCGWNRKNDIPSESTFSRAFAEFAHSELPSKVHETIVKTYCGDKLVGHISRDSTAISAREKPAKKESIPKPSPRRKKGRPRKDAPPIVKELKTIEIQLTQTREENCAGIPTRCDCGTKRNSKGHTSSWIGYKLHIDTIDGDIPASVLLSSASMHDSQAAIPLAQISAERITNLYDLMDSAYDAQSIKEMSLRLNHVPVIDPNKRRGEAKDLCPAKKQRYKQRSSAERVNSNLKDNFGGDNVRVKGAKKVMAHLMFGVIVLTAEALFRLVS
jgi:hypothetical protein